jgi:hypothetical protein
MAGSPDHGAGLGSVSREQASMLESVFGAEEVTVSVRTAVTTTAL